MSKPTDLVQGTLDLLILRTLQKEALHGWAVSERIQWSQVWSFDRSYWYILGLHVLYAAVFFPFRQTFAIEYLQHVKGLDLQQAGNVNSGVFAAAIFATRSLRSSLT